jgi:hypothetical protein
MYGVIAQSPLASTDVQVCSSRDQQRTRGDEDVYREPTAIAADRGEADRNVALEPDEPHSCRVVQVEAVDRQRVDDR